MTANPSGPGSSSTGKELEALAQQALHVARKARKHGLSLSGSNFYAYKLVELRADATNLFRELSAGNAGDVSAMAEMIEEVFAPGTVQMRRNEVAKDLVFSLRTTWRASSAPHGSETEKVLFPLNILEDTSRGYLVRIGRQMNGCYVADWYDACAVMMRRLLEVVIIEAFENSGIAGKIKGADGNYLDLSGLIKHALGETTWTLTRNARKFLPQLREVGHMSAHGRYFSARKEDIENIRQGCRVVIEEFLHHAHLL